MLKLKQEQGLQNGKSPKNCNGSSYGAISICITPHKLGTLNKLKSCKQAVECIFFHSCCFHHPIIKNNSDGGNGNVVLTTISAVTPGPNGNNSPPRGAQDIIVWFNNNWGPLQCLNFIKQ